MSEESDEDEDEELTEVKICWNNKNKADWYDTNKFKIILTTIDSNNFNHKNKIGKLKFNDINSLINSVKDDTISEADTKKKMNALERIKKAEVKNKRLISSQKKLLNLFDDLLEAICNNNKNENDNVSVNENDNDDNDNDNERENDYERYQDHKIKQLHNYFKVIHETKSFGEQIEILKKEII